MSHSIPPPSERRHGIAATLALVDKIHALAYDLTLEPADALRRIRDLFIEHGTEGSEGNPR